ncbi:MAG: HAMP domain-containing protein [Kofleriaceae bacterium]|nr:HAMP domain-containing protein [Myxococcales bacterium]MCB9562094.1 HAMP domain-containing protein [Kofleriaceae bacterium]
MKLRGRFTLWFALAALVPIALAAVVTRYVVARSYRREYERTRIAAEQALRREVERAGAQIEDAVGPDALGSTDLELIGRFTLSWRAHGDYVEAQRWVREQGSRMVGGLMPDVVFLTDDHDEVLAALHYPALMGESDARPRQWATRSKGQAFYDRVLVKHGDRPEKLLVVEAARAVRADGHQLYIAAGRAVGPSLFDVVRRSGRIDARVVDAGGEVLVPPAEPGFEHMLAGAPIRIPLPGVDGAPVAWIELAVTDEGLDQLLLEVTLVSGVLAAVAVLLTVLLGIAVARRMTRDLDRLVEGAQAAARGELEHRVPVTAADEVGAVAAAFNLMMEDLKDAKERLVIAERIAAWQEIARRLAHEIKNPLTPIQMAMDTLRKTWRKQHPQFAEVLEESTATVLEEADRLKRIVAEFSEFARMPKPTFGPCDVGEIVGAALSLYQGAAPVEAKLEDGLPAIEADRGQVNQVLLNLLENARDAIAQRRGGEGSGGGGGEGGGGGGDGGGGRIVVSTRRGDAGDRIELVVEDNGPGVPPEAKDRLFAPYFTTKHGKGGTGLGLAIVHRIVGDHGGRVVVQDVPTGGARFVVEFPIRQGQPLLASRM